MAKNPKEFHRVSRKHYHKKTKNLVICFVLFSIELCMHTSSLSQLGFTFFWTQYMCIVCQKRPFELFNSVAKEHLIVNISVGQKYSSPPSSIVQTWKSEGRFFKPDLGLVCLDTPTVSLPRPHPPFLDHTPTTIPADIIIFTLTPPLWHVS